MIRNNATILATEIGLKNLTFENVAERCPVPTSAGTVRHYFKYLHDLWLEAAADNDDLHKQAVEMGLINE